MAERKVEPGGNIIDIKHVSKWFGDKQVLDDVDVMYITEIDAEFEGDTYFTQFDENLFTKEINSRYVSTVPYTYVTYTRK